MRVQNSWYCVKLPGPEELRRKISWREARSHESELFSKDPWTRQPDLEHRLGVPALVERLSTLLSEHVSKTSVIAIICVRKFTNLHPLIRLPGVLAKINAKINEILAQTRKFSSPLAGKPVQVVTRLIVDFQRKVDIEIAGTIAKDGLIQKMNAHADTFRCQLRGSAPLFIPFTHGEVSERQDVPLIQFLPEEEQDLRDEGTHPVLYLSDVEIRAQGSVCHLERCCNADASHDTALCRANCLGMCHSQ